jgi:hypothetical protein
MLDRRSLLANAVLLSAAATALIKGQPEPPQSAPVQNLLATARNTRKRLDFADGSFAGPAYEWLVEHGQQAAFFLIGEEHGIAENPKLAAQLFGALVPSGYRHAAVEISPPMAAELDRVSEKGGIAALKDYYRDAGANAVFFGMREEAEWLTAVRAAVPREKLAIWGCDYEVGADRRLIQMLEKMSKPKAAKAALAALRADSTASWAKYDATRDPRFIFSFAGNPELVRAVRAAWPNAPTEAEWIIDTLKETLEINRLWGAGKGWESNQRRATNLRKNFLRHWRPCQRKAKPPRVMLKFGSNHMVRGVNDVGAMDLGSLLPELTEAHGSKSFHLMVLPGRDCHVATFDPTAFRYFPRPTGREYGDGLEWLRDEAWRDSFTLFETAPFRPMVHANCQEFDDTFQRAVFGFDAVLVMSRSTASTNLL